MKVRLNKRHLSSELTGAFELHVEPIRAAYVPRDEGNAEIGERGLPEYIFTYGREIPTSHQEPELYTVPHNLIVKGPEEFWLQYPLATVILISDEEDDKFRKDYKDLLERIEALYIE